MARTKVLVRTGLGVLFVSLLVALMAGPVRAQPSAQLQADNTPQVCQQIATTIQGGLSKYVGQLQKVGAQAQSGDLAGANATVKQAAPTLQALASQIRQQNNAENPQLKSVLDQVAGQLDQLSEKLTDVNALQNLDTGQIEKLGTQVSSICGPSASIPAPPTGLPSAAPNSTG